MIRKPAAILFVLSLAVLALALVPAAGLAAKGGNPERGGGGGGNGGGGNGGGGKPGGSGSNGSLTLVMVTDQDGNGAPNWGDTITFNVSSTSTTPYVSVRCRQGGTLVYAADAGFYDSYPWPGARLMPLSSPSWTGGAADCTTTLNDSPSLSFHVDA